MRPDLPETYYLDNVLTLFEHVSRVYADILESSQAGFLAGFGRLGPDAQKLCIRLLNRSHDYFRASKLNYPEIASIEAALTELAAAGFIVLNGDIEPPTLLSVFTRAELLALVDDQTGLDKLRRHELDAALLERDDAACFETLACSDTLIQVLRREDYQICQMLFFGNLNQSMTDFVLRDLGLYQFETYGIDHDHRPYRNTLEIQQHWLLYQLEALFQLADVSDRQLLDEIIDMIPEGIEIHAPAYRKCERLRYEIARQFERLGDLESALGLYRQCRLPPGRERVARIHDKQGKHQQALDDCLQIVDDPMGEDEIQFACMFATRLARRHHLLLPPVVEQHHGNHQPEIIELELEYQDSVELAVAGHYAALDNADSCFYLENSLFNGVLGLLIWDVVFAPLPGAFFNPFQYRPSDFYAYDFCDSREQLIAQTWESISTNEDIWRIVSTRWQQKQGLMNPLVNWQGLDLEIIETALERIDHVHWRAVFERILRDLRNNRAGFPDLVHFPPSGGYCLIEVKGPGDSLQKNQQRWMQYFHEHGIPHRLARVTWRTS
jgi:hypothetical protein